MNINELVNYLKKCDDAYYNSDKPIVTNDTYDSMVASLRKLDPSNPYLNKVGANIKDTNNNKVGRVTPMGTLSKYHVDDEVKSWLDDHSSDSVLLAPKYDGFGVELTYINGKLVMASTRGTGYTGEDVTDAMKLVNYVPLELPNEFINLTIVRGEAIIPRKNHDIMKSKGYTAMRNAVPGIVRSGNKDALPYVDFVAYEFFDGDNRRSDQRTRYFDLFNVEDIQLYKSNEFNDILLSRNNMGVNKESYKYEIDGMVLKTDKIYDDDLLCPTHQIAWKFKSNRRETILREIEASVGVTGNISVVGIFDPVEFQGAELRRASFGSIQRFNELKPTIGCTLEVSRRGDIIPFIEEVYDTDEFVVMDTCPCCGSKLVDNKCVNKSCSDKIKLRVINYVGSLGVKGIGPGLVTRLIEGEYIKDLADIYSLDAEIIGTLPRQGQSAIDKWKILQTKELSVLQFLCAYPFDNIGESAWKSVLDIYDINKLISMDLTIIKDAGIKGLGESKCNAIINQFNDNKDDIIKCLQHLELV